MRPSTFEVVPLGRKLAAVGAAMMGMLAAGPVVPDAEASHFRYGHTTYTKTASTSADFSVTAAFRRSAYGGTDPDDFGPQIGDVFSEDTGGTELAFGDVDEFEEPITSGQLDFVVTAVNKAEDWVLAKALDPARPGGNSSDVAIGHTYANSGPWTAAIASCCTIFELNNNSEGSYVAGSLVNLASDVESPQSSVNPIVDVGNTGVQNFTIPAIDPGGQTVRFRLATDQEGCGGDGCEANPAGMTINSTTGEVSWDTTSATEGLWYASVIVEAYSGVTLVSASQVTFLIRVSSSTNQAPAWQSPTPADGTEYTVAPGTALNVSLAANDPDAGHSVQISHLGLPTGATLTPTNGNPASGSFSWTPTIDQLGDYLVTFTAQDNGTPLRAAPSRTIVIHVANGDPDETPPDTTIQSGPDGPTSDNTPSFTFTSTESGTFECSIDGGPFTTCTSGITLNALNDGPHTFAVRAIDGSNNVDPSPASRAFSVDATPPDTTIQSGPSGPTSDNTPSFTFTSTESGTFECSIDGGPFTTCTSGITLNALNDGPHTFAVRAIDAVGNVDASPASRSFTVDTTPPDTTITDGPSGTTADNTPTFTFTSTEGGSTFECRVDGGTFTPCTSGLTLPALTDGAHTFEVRATDGVGNTDPTPASRTFTVDTTPPDTTITDGPTGTTADNTPTFTFTSTEGGSTFECRVDGGTFTPCTSGLTLPALTDGAHTFEVRATDGVGNTDPTPASRTFTVDATAPDTSITDGPTGTVTDDTPTFAFSSPDAGATFECRIDGGAFTACSSGLTLPALEDGSHTFEVRAIDAVGNTDPSPASRTFTVAPEGTIGDVDVPPVVTDDFLCGVQRRGLCHGVRGQANFKAPGNAVWFVDGKIGKKAGGSAAVPKSIRLGKLTKKIKKPGTVKFRVPLSAKKFKKLKRLAKGRRVVLILTTQFTDASGRRTKRKSTIKLKF